MCHDSCIIFGKIGLTKEDIKGKRVIEIGSLNVNGSLRPFVTSLEPSLYIGIDIEEGPGVDIVCNADDIIEKFGKESFDVVISTELLEHVKDWKKVVSNIKNICKPGGIILITTRSYGFPFHSYPYDFWRYELEDMANIFSDCNILLLEKDLQQPGIFIKIKKHDNFVEKDLSDYMLYNIIYNNRIRYMSKLDDTNIPDIHNKPDNNIPDVPYDNMPKVLIGIPTYNGAHRVDWLLQSISMNTTKNIDYKIVICDDSGNKEHQEKTRAVVDKWSLNLNISLLINDKNIGVSKSWNKIIKSEDEYSQCIIIINDDIIVNKNWLETMVYFLKNNPNAGVVFYDFLKIEERDIPGLLSNDFQEILLKFQANNYDSKNTYPIRCMHYVGCFFGFNRDKYDMVEGFDEEYFANFEETDFCTTLASYGFPSYILRYPISWHIYSATFKSTTELNYQDIFEKSQQYYIKKWKGDRATTENIYMSRIPPQKVKWVYNNNIHEETIPSNQNQLTQELTTHQELTTPFIKTDGLNITIKEYKPKIGIGIPVGGYISPIFVEMLFARFAEWIQKYVVTIIIETVIPIDLARNKIVNSARRHNCDYIFFIDSDVLVEQGQLEKLLSNDKDIVSGIYYQKRPPYYQLPRKKVTENLYVPLELEGNELIEIDGTGMGCVLIKMNVFEKIHHPWFEFKYYKIDERWDQLSEDLYFCQKLQSTGIKIYCDPTIQCSHIGTIVYPTLSTVYKELRTYSMNETHKTVAELSEFTHISPENVYNKWYTSTELVAKEYNEFISQDHRNPKDFYKTNKNYIFELTRLHTEQKRSFDTNLVKSIKEKYPFAKKILDFGSGCGQNAINLAEAGYDVSIADYDGYTSRFAMFRTKKRGLDVKFYDIETPINDKFDIILAFDVLDHIPNNEFDKTIELLKSLKADGGKILANTNFGTQGGLYPMRYESSPEKIKLIEKLND